MFRKKIAFLILKQNHRQTNLLCITDKYNIYNIYSTHISYKLNFVSRLTIFSQLCLLPCGRSQFCLLCCLHRVLEMASGYCRRTAILLQEDADIVYYSPFQNSPSLLQFKINWQNVVRTFLKFLLSNHKKVFLIRERTIEIKLEVRHWSRKEYQIKMVISGCWIWFK